MAKWYEKGRSPWGFMYKCAECGYVRDKDERRNNVVCPKCGSLHHEQFVGRWIVFHRDIGLFRTFIEFLKGGDIVDFKFEYERHDQQNVLHSI